MNGFILTNPEKAHVEFLIGNLYENCKVFLSDSVRIVIQNVFELLLVSTLWRYWNYTKYGIFSPLNVISNIHLTLCVRLNKIKKVKLHGRHEGKPDWSLWRFAFGRFCGTFTVFQEAFICNFYFSGKTKAAEKEKAIEELLTVVKGHAKQLIYAHDTVRVIQCLLTLNRAEVRAQLFEELKGDVLRMAKSKYAKFFLLKMLKTG